MKKELKKMKGITLVALIITVIVMLILAGVAISVITDGDGLFSKVSSATKEHRKQSLIEGINLAELYLEIDNEFDKTKNLNIENLMAKLKEVLKTNESEYTIVEESSTQTALITDNKTNTTIKVLIDENGKVTIEDVVFDNVAPKAFEMTVGEVTTTTITISGSTEDGDATEESEVSGLLGYQYKIDNGEWSSITQETTHTLTRLISGKTYTLSMRAVDKAGNITEVSNKNVSVTTEVTNGTMANGTFDAIAGVNSPDISKLPTATTSCVVWSEDAANEEVLSSTVLANWYDYENGKWANIKTTSTDKSLEAYWVWVPRFAYRLPESTTATEIEVTFINGNGTTGANGETCYYSTDTAITTGGTGLYANATDLAKGLNGNEKAWIVHPAFTFGDEQLAGIWVGKFEPHNNDNKLEIRPSVSFWDHITMKDAFSVSRAVQNDGGVLGTNTSTTGLDSHMMKNIEWGLVAILSQSKYGIYNPKSMTGLVNNGGDGTLRVWNNVVNNGFTGHVAKDLDGAELTRMDISQTDAYNTGNGPKGSTTGTVYGIYDMAAGGFEYVAAVLSGAESDKLGTTDTKYFDAYINATSSNTDYESSKIGDMLAELLPNNKIAWNEDQLIAPVSINNNIHRGGGSSNGVAAGIFKIGCHSTNSDASGHTFRTVFVTY